MCSGECLKVFAYILGSGVGWTRMTDVDERVAGIEGKQGLRHAWAVWALEFGGTRIRLRMVTEQIRLAELCLDMPFSSLQFTGMLVVGPSL